MKSDLMFKVVVESPEKLLEREDVRYVHFCKRRHNRPEELEILFTNGVLYLADSVTEKEVTRFCGLIDTFLGQKYQSGARQEERVEKVKSRFGDDGVTTMVDMFFWKMRENKKGARKDGKKDD